MGKRTIVVLAVIWMILLVAGVSSSLTLALSGVGTVSEDGSMPSAVLISGDEYEKLKRFSRLDEVLSVVENEYYQEVDEETLLLGAIEGALSSLGDPYTFYYRPEDMEANEEHNSGVYKGVGLQLSLGSEGDIVVARVFKNGPADLAGLRSGDCLVAVSGESVEGESMLGLTRATELIKNGEEQTVDVTVLRNGVRMDFSMTKSTVTINRIEYHMLPDSIGYIRIYEFLGDDAKGFKEAIATLTAEGMRSLIVDVRYNPGGLLNDVVEIADVLLPEGLIVYVEDRHGRRESYYSDADALELPIAVLVNGSSASASEILAGAVQDYALGPIVGETTYGKGIVQTLVPFHSDGAGMQLTTSSYFTPAGNSIHGVGIVPDYEVVNEDGVDYTQGAPDIENDVQLKKAWSLLKEAN